MVGFKAENTIKNNLLVFILRLQRVCVQVVWSTGIGLSALLLIHLLTEDHSVSSLCNECHLSQQKGR